VMLPIPGTGSLEHLRENCDAALVTLDAAAMKELETAPEMS
jgi:aryl-alcohol dehydrogenase-like predicted oxidoreductase